MTKQYLDLARTVLETGATKHDRTGTGTKSIFGYQMRFDLAEGFPILTTKKVAFGLIKSELLWFLKGDTNIKYLLENNNHIWDEWAFERYVQSADYTGPNMEDFGHRVLKEEGFKKPVKIAIMGCIVNGPGEASDADIGIAGGKDCAVLFEHGEKIRTLKGDIVSQFVEEIHKL